jgi:hypothetical protein
MTRTHIGRVAQVSKSRPGPPSHSLSRTYSLWKHRPPPVIPTGAYRISYFALLATTTCAALRKESRMQTLKATGLDRKSGGAQWRDLRFGSSHLEMFFDRGIMCFRPTQGAMKTAPIQQLLFMQAPPSPLSSRPERTRISYFALLATTTCAALS